MNTEQDSDALLRFQAAAFEWRYLKDSGEMIDRRRAEIAATLGADAAELRTRGDPETVEIVAQILRAADWVEDAPTTEARMRALEGRVQMVEQWIAGLEVDIIADPLPVPRVTVL